MTELTGYYFLDAAAALGVPDWAGLAHSRFDFPALDQRVNGRPLVWFDNAATTQKPRAVIDAVSRYYARDNSNVHRGAHALAARSTDAYESARAAVARFLGVSGPDEIVFVRGTTEGMNLLAQTLGRHRVGPGDEILLTMLEHHANIVPWQLLAQQTGARLRVADVDETGQVRVEDFARQLGPRTKIAAIAHVSNALGTIVPVAELASLAHAAGAVVVVDGAQAVAHVPVDVTALGADFYVFSGHKVFGPTGIGAVYGRRELLADLPPWQGGGSMIRDVTFEHTTYSDPPQRFEAGTPSVADAVGLHAALDYVSALGMPAIAAHEQALTERLTETLVDVPGVRLVGTAHDKVGVVSFVLDGVRTEDVGRLLDREGIAVRAGHHCAQPALRRFGLEATVRPSLAFYNSGAEIERFGRVIRSIAAGRPVGVGGG